MSATHPPIYSATYSNVNVYEMTVSGLPIMRREKDDYMNATQILKLAGFSKPRRTKVLEKEVLTGTHEKIQGGYGKYQGTWIPLAACRSLAKKYDVFSILEPIIDFDPTSQTAPKKPSAVKSEASTPKVKKTPTRVITPRSSPIAKGAPGTPFVSPRFQRRRFNSPSNSEISSNYASPRRSYDNLTTSPEPVEPIIKKRKGENKFYFTSSNPPLSVNEDCQEENEILSEQRSGHSRGVMPMEVLRRSPLPLSHRHRQREILMYIYNDASFPDLLNLLRNPLTPYQFDINFILDQEGNTCLHWASALGKVELARLLLRHGANAEMTNKWGHTALVSSVLCSNNFHSQTFFQLLDMLRSCVYTRDSESKTILHHIASRGFVSVQSSFYYMHCLAFWLDTRRDSKLPGFLNQQDCFGDTALHIACRAEAYLVAELLVSLGAKKSLINSEGETVWKICGDDHRLFKILRGSMDKNEMYYSDVSAEENNHSPSEMEDDDLSSCESLQDYKNENTVEDFQPIMHSGIWAGTKPEEKVDQGFKKALIVFVEQGKDLLAKAKIEGKAPAKVSSSVDSKNVAKSSNSPDAASTSPKNLDSQATLASSTSKSPKIAETKIESKSPKIEAKSPKIPETKISAKIPIFFKSSVPATKSPVISNTSSAPAKKSPIFSNIYSPATKSPLIPENPQNLPDKSPEIPEVKVEPKNPVKNHLPTPDTLLKKTVLSVNKLDDVKKQLDFNSE